MMKTLTRSLALLAALCLVAGAPSWAAEDDPAHKELEQARRELERAREELQRSAHALARAIAKVEKDSPDARMYEFVANPNRAMLGIILDDDAGDEPRGVRVVGITPGGGAEKAGLRAGDIILSLNGKSVAAGSGRGEQPEQKLRTQMQTVQAGNEVSLEYERQGKPHTVVVITTRPLHFALHELEPLLDWAEEGAPRPPMPHIMKFHRMKEMKALKLVALDEDLAYYFKTKEGVLVVKAPKSGALTLKSGDVIQKLDGEKVTHPVAVMDRLFEGEKGSIKLEVLRRGKPVTIQGTLPLLRDEDEDRP